VKVSGEVRAKRLEEVSPVQRLTRVVLMATIVLAALPAAAALATPRMPVGFYDDNSFRWDPKAAENLKAAQDANASILHVTAYWPTIAPTKPASPLNGNDPAYHIGDLDALIARAGSYGMQVMINISGAPTWANGGKPPNYPPTSTSTIRDFAQMLAKRYNGSTTRGLVTRWSVWNEPNLQFFLTPQYSPSGKIVSPAAYLRIYKAAYAGIKAGNPNALVAVGETSNRGRDKPVPADSNQTDTVSPGNFAYLLSKLDPKLKFDAWATHPYPTDPGLGPTQKVKWPNVTLTRITQFGESLQKWFHRRVPIWITEYGEQTAPQHPLGGGVSYAQQARDAKTALELAAASPYVEMFTWFTIKDSAGTWQSGLITSSGKKKPAYSVFAKTAQTIDGQTQYVAAGKNPTLSVDVPLLAYHDPHGTSLGLTYRIYDGKKLIQVQQLRTKLTKMGSVSFVAKFKPSKGKQYTANVAVGDSHGQKVVRTLALLPPQT
jgi:aryl-phospho-beta-D-glucosidase BglC (GH1 family)